MGIVEPKVSVAQLKEGMRIAATDGRETHQALPAVTTDSLKGSKADANDPKSEYYGAKTLDRDGYRTNRELGNKINEAFKQLKKTDQHGPQFVLAWRLYPNKDHPRWNWDKAHSCGCGCGGMAPQDDPAKK